MTRLQKYKNNYVEEIDTLDAIIYSVLFVEVLIVCGVVIASAIIMMGV